MKNTFYLFLTLSIISCSKSSDNDISEANNSPFEECINSLPNCNLRGEYCLFGFKWGEGNDFASTGNDVEGPKIPGGTVTYSLQELPNFVSNHEQVDLPTLSFDELPDCAKSVINGGFILYSTYANIQFEELPDDSDSDIKIFVAEVNTCGNGIPNFNTCLLYTSPSPRDGLLSRMPSSA